MVSMLSTKDNPFNPFTQWDEWFAYDEQKGYHSCSYLARVARTVDDLSDLDYSLAVDRAIDEIVKFNLTGNYVKLTQPTPRGV